MVLVNEEYANLVEMKDIRVFVRRKWVPMTYEAINEYYGMQNYDHKECEFF